MVIYKDVLNKRTNKRIFVELTPSMQPDYDEELDKKARLSRMFRIAELKAQREYELERREGYCPHCHTLLPLSGECDCGYSKPKKR